MAFRTAIGFIVECEQTLGWPLTEELMSEEALYKKRMIHAARIRKEIAKDPELYTWKNLGLAVEYCRQRRILAKPPLYVLKVTERAVAAAPKPKPPRPLGERIDAAIAWEMSNQEPGWMDWVGRLSRAAGPGRADMHAAWAKARQP